MRYPLIILLVSCCTNAQNNPVIELWPNGVPGIQMPKQEDIEVLNADDQVLRITKVTNPTLTVLEPDATKKNGAGIIICPGGGYHILAANLEGDEIATWFADLGYTTFVLHYRVPDQREGALQDLQRALRIVRANAEKWQLDPTKIGVMGFSAGGSLSARASTNFTKETYPKIDATDEISSRPDFTLLIYPAYLDQGGNRTLTPELEITGNTPPMFIFATADDPYANSALVMATALRDGNIPVEMHLMPVGGHGYGLRKGKIAAETWPKLGKIWLNRLFGQN